ncbi:aldehyde dehydrogenase [Trametopsis cervina]|nr:aldehyde dehydrogenase [Trametopsis cervina]
MVDFTPVEDVPKIFEELRASFRTGKTKDIAYRKEQLSQLAWMLRDNHERWAAALKADLGRPEWESHLLEINPATGEAVDAYKNVAKWAKTENARWSLVWSAMKPQIRKEPKGVVLIITPFNYPIHLTITHLTSAIAAGNTVVIKPSELCPNICSLYAELIPKYLDPGVCRVVNGDIPVVTKLLELPWDHVVYVGSGRVAKIISAAAAKHLTPVTLELGGKSPVFIDPGCDMELAARRILWSKIANAGQICVAPDYVLVPREAQDRFVDELKKAYAEFFPEGDPAKSDSFSRLVSQAHAERVKGYLDASKGTVVLGGATDVEKRYVAPTVLRDVPLDDSTMVDEIFGPLLPIIPIKDVDEAIDIVNSKEHALALYVFTKDNKFKTKVFDSTQSGGAFVNEVVIHVGTTGLPFGGIGPSGSGYLTGKYGFDVLTHQRCTLESAGWIDKLIMKGRYPPYTAASTRILRAAMKVSLPPRAGNAASGIRKRWGLWLIFTLAGLASAILMKRRIAS